MQAELVLQRIDRGDVSRVGRVHEYPDGDQYIRGVELIDSQLVLARIVENPIDVVVLVDDHHRDIPVPAVRDHSVAPAADVHDGLAVEGVAVHPDDRLMVYRDGARYGNNWLTPPACAWSAANIRSVSARSKLVILTVVSLMPDILPLTRPGWATRPG